MLARLLLVHSAAFLPTSNRRCPCLKNESESWTRQLELTSNGSCPGTLNTSAGRCPEGEFWSEAPGYGGECLRRDFGTNKCDDWDMRRQRCGGSDMTEAEMTEAEWCAQRWCFVDPNACRASEYLMWQSTLAEGLFYSYGACGGDDSSWRDHVFRSALRGKVLRAAVPMFRYPDHYAYVYDSDGKRVRLEGTPRYGDVRGYGGIWIELYEEIAQNAGFTLQWHIVSNGSRTAFSSEWTACVADVRQGLLDLCVGNFWVKQDRLQMAAFVAPTFTELFYMMVPRRFHTSFFEYVSVPVAPFSGALWASIFGALLCLAMAFFVIDHFSHQDEKRSCRTGVGLFGEEVFFAMLALFGGGSPNDQKVSEMQSEQAIEAQHASIQGRAARMTQASVRLPRASMDLDLDFKCGVAPGSTPAAGGEQPLRQPLDLMVMPPKSRLPKRLLTLAWAGFTIVVLTLYQAKMTATLVELQQIVRVDSIDECKEQGCTLCTNTVQIDGMRSKYGDRINYKGMGFASNPAPTPTPIPTLTELPIPTPSPEPERDPDPILRHGHLLKGCDTGSDGAGVGLRRHLRIGAKLGSILPAAVL